MEYWVKVARVDAPDMEEKEDVKERTSKSRGREDRKKDQEGYQVETKNS